MGDVVKVQNKQLGVSFDLPDRLTVDQLDEYQRNVAGYLNQYKDTFLSTVRYRAMIYSAAVEANLITAWECEAMAYDNPTDAKIIIWAGGEIESYIKGYTDIPPNSL